MDSAAHLTTHAMGSAAGAVAGDMTRGVAGAATGAAGAAAQAASGTAGWAAEAARHSWYSTLASAYANWAASRDKTRQARGCLTVPGSDPTAFAAPPAAAASTELRA